MSYRSGMASDGRLITSGEVARRLRVSVRKVQRMVVAEELPVAQRVPGAGAGRLLFDEATIEYIARQREAAKA